MKIYPNSGESSPGASFLIYAEPDFGKTHSLGTLPEPIAILNSEPKDPRRVLGWCKKEITFYEPETYDEEMQLLHQMEMKAREGKLPFKSIAKDSLSFIQGVYKLVLEDDRYEARAEKDKARSGLIDRFRIDEADWGAVGSIMKRITSALNRLSKYGVIVVATATVVESPRWNRALAAAPAFQGKEFPSVVNGYFDFIGYVKKPYSIEDNGKAHSPIVSFVSEEGKYVARCSHPGLLRLKMGPLDFEKILRVIQS